ncbi:helix-turn-helix domain-containing protein [Rhodoferax saidenbachensis]|uniref:HTH cro/C1-type domain-containing protein n=1 Tax=Rhodoferax saidenbachensis TaxID=1484693 RepID=A0A1P8K8U1_9BURK|nr:hypothetical protein RS694_07640 [Rhodoferax saidenbachensis]
MQIDEAFGRLLRKHRLDRDLTATALATNSGITRRYLRMLELGQASPTLAVIVRLADSLGLEINELVKQAVELTAEK